MTKKEIKAAIRSGNAETIIKTYTKVSGHAVTDLFHQEFDLYRFIERNAPSSRAADKACHAVHQKANIHGERFSSKAYLDSGHLNDRIRVLRYLRANLADIRKGDHYCKVPFIGHHNVYMCSPLYGHSDYNKWQALPIAGNVAFCQFLLDIKNRLTTQQ